MKNIIFLAILVLGLSTVTVDHVIPAESTSNNVEHVATDLTSVVTVDKTETDGTVDETETETETETDKTAVEEDELSNPWVSFIWLGISIILALISGVITLAAKLGVKHIEKKLGFDIPDAIEEIAEGYLTKGINWTENWAKNKANEPRSEDKMAETIRYAVEKAGENKALRRKIDEKGKEIVERLLKSKETPEDSTPKFE